MTVVAAGLPHINLDWLKLRDAPIKRVDVVFYDPVAPEEVAPATGVVAQEQGHFGLGSAEQRGRDVGRNPTPAPADVTKPNARRVALGQGQTGEGDATAANVAKTAAAENAAASPKSDSSQPAEGKDNRTEKMAAARSSQSPTQAAAAAQTATAKTDAKPGDASAAGQVGGKGKDDRSTTAQNQLKQESESAQQASTTAAKDAGGSPPRTAPLATSLPILDREDRGKPKQETAQEQPARVVVARLQTAEIQPQPVPPKKEQAQLQASESTVQPVERPRDLREDGGPSNLKLAVKASAGDAMLPATGTGTSNESGAASGAPKTSPPTPVRSAQAMTPAPAESSTNVATKLMLQTMPGLDGTLAAAMANPEAVPVSPPTPRREQVIARMQKAANQGFAYAQYGVARRELIGQGVARDPKAAADMLERAARQGYPMAQLTLGYMALKGYGVKQDKTEALTWLTLAASQGNGDAARAAALIEPTLTAQELIAARRSVSDWKSVMGAATPPAAAEGKATPERGPLQDAVAHGDVAAVRALAARGEDANGRDREGRTAMINAGWRGDGAMVESLLEVGADPDIVDNEGRTSIMWAAGNGYPNVVERLIKAGVELDLKDKTGRTAVTSAALNGHTDVVKALVTAKAKLDVRDDRGKTALDYALRQNYPDIVQILEKAGAKR
ncbi:MAG: ankyrin repeat domain-containing protein [Alphaproteobacteria bacterium]|nr:ankyrin repeat domain-containing protein [Alphaproteobacteria bacterium]